MFHGMIQKIILKHATVVCGCTQNSFPKGTFLRCGGDDGRGGGEKLLYLSVLDGGR